MSPKMRVTSREAEEIKKMRASIMKTVRGYPARCRDDGKPTHEVDPEFSGNLNGLALWGRHVDLAMKEVTNPPESKRISKDGAWVMVTRQLPPMERRMDRHVRVGRSFWAVQEDGTDEFGFSPEGHYKIVITTSKGHVCLWPYEYSVIDPVTLFELWDSKELLFHPFANENMRWSDAIFYLRSRGIGLVDAIVMALGTVKGPVGWFEPEPRLARACEAMEARVHRWKPKAGRKFTVTINVEGAAKPPPEEGSCRL